MNSRLAMSAMVLTALTVVFTPAPPVMGQGALFLEDLTVPQPRLVAGFALAVSPAVATQRAASAAGCGQAFPSRIIHGGEAIVQSLPPYESGS